MDKGSEFYNASSKKWLQDNNVVVMYSTYNKGKSVVAERFIRTLKSKIYKHITSISKNVYIEKLDDIVDEYNNTYHATIKMKPINVKDNIHINTLTTITTLQIGLKKYLLLKKLKILFLGLTLLMI